MIATLVLAPLLLEVGLGVASTGRLDIPYAPTLSVRVARQSEHWSIGGRALLLAGPEGQDYAEHPGPNAGGFGVGRCSRRPRFAPAVRCSHSCAEPPASDR